MRKDALANPASRRPEASGHLPDVSDSQREMRAGQGPGGSRGCVRAGEAGEELHSEPAARSK